MGTMVMEKKFSKMPAADLARTQRTRHPRGVAEIARDNEDKHFLTNGNILNNHLYLTFLSTGWDRNAANPRVFPWRKE